MSLNQRLKPAALGLTLANLPQHIVLGTTPSGSYDKIGIGVHTMQNG